MSNRMTYLAAASASLVLATAACAPNASDDESSGTVDVAMITSLSGPIAAYGESYREGFEAGLDHATDGTGEVDGTAIEIEWIDDQANPDTAVSKARDVIGQGVDIIAGTASSGVATAMAEQAQQNEVLFVSGAAATDAITGANDYTFRSGRQTFQDVATAGEILGDVEGAKITVFAQDNVFGQGNVAAVEAVLGARGAEVESILVAEDATEFTPFAAQINRSAPDLTFVAWAGDTTGAMWEALGQQDVFDKTTVVTGLGDQASYNAYGEVSDKIEFLNHYFPGAAGTEAEQQMIDHIEESGGTPDIFSPDGFVTAQLIVHAIAEGDDVPSMIDALEGYTFDSVKGELTVRSEDHALLQPMFHAKLVESDAGWTPELIDTVDNDSIAPPVAGE